MYINLWSFLAIFLPSVMLMIISVIYFGSKQKMKELEIEALKVQHSNLQNEVDDAVKRGFGEIAERIEVLESIITSKKYELNEEISNLDQ